MRDTVDTGVASLKILEKFHELGYVHGDIKPDNLILPENSSNVSKVHLIDFGQCRKYRDSGGKHLPNKLSQLYHNPWFASHNECLGSSISRRDDVISLIYTLIHGRDHFGSLLSKANNDQAIYLFKLTASAKQVCEGNRTQFLAPIMEEAMSYRYEQKPNYDKLKFLLKKVLIEHYIKPSPNFVFDD